MSGNQPPIGPHLEARELAAFLDHDLEPGERGRVEAHLAECDACRAEAGAVAGVIAAVPKPGRHRRALVVSSILAAAAALLLFLRSPTAPSPAIESTLRDVGGAAAREGTPVIEALFPEDRAVPVDSVRFVWRPAGRDALYHLVLGDALGDVVWQQETRDTVLRLPAAVRLEPGHTYTWHVDALLDGGRSAASRARRFGTIP